LKNDISKSNGSRVRAFGDNPSFHISPVKLDGINYLVWSHSCLLFIKARGLHDYIIEEQVRLATTDPSLNRWYSESSLVMSWHINSMEPSIACGYLLLDSASKM